MRRISLFAFIFYIYIFFNFPEGVPFYPRTPPLRASMVELEFRFLFKVTTNCPFFGWSQTQDCLLLDNTNKLPFFASNYAACLLLFAAEKSKKSVFLKSPFCSLKFGNYKVSFFRFSDPFNSKPHN